MRITPALFIIALTLSAHARSACIRVDRVDPEFPAGLVGRYELVGRDAVSGAPYTGALTVEAGTRSYTLRRTVKGRVVKGEAWIERCGADGMTALHVRYAASPKPLEMRCALGNDGDNYFRLSCITHYEGTRDSARGLEAMFQLQ